MPTSAPPASDPIILGLVFHPRYTGFAALGRDGPLPRGFGVADFRCFRSPAEMRRAASAFLSRVVERHRPAVVVLCVPERRKSEHILHTTAVRELRRRGGAMVIRSLRQARVSLFGHKVFRRRSQEAMLAARYDAALARYVNVGHERRRYWSRAWDALVLAFNEFMLLFPDGTSGRGLSSAV